MAYGPARVLGETTSQIITWKQFGAIGDGVTDDTAAINACMAAARANGWAVHASSPAVGYRISAPINIHDGAILRGDNKVRTKIICERTNAIDCIDSADDVAGLTGDWEIRNLLFVGDDDMATDGADHIGLYVRRAVRFLVESCEFRGFTDACVLDGRKNAAGTWYGLGDGKLLNCTFQTDNAKPQTNPTNNYPRYCFEVRAEANGVGGADGVSLYNCRLYGEILADAEVRAGDGVATAFAFGPIVAGKQVTVDDHVVVQYVASAGAAASQLSAGVEYTIDRATAPNSPTFDFSAGASPLGPPAKVVLLSTTGDGVTRNFRLDARPSFTDHDSGRGVVALVDVDVLTAGADYSVADGNNKSYAFTVDAGTDRLTVSGSGAAELMVGRIVRASSGDTLPGGLAADTDYYATEILDLTCKLAATYANAVAGTPSVIDLTDAGLGGHTLSIAHAIEFAAAPGSAVAIEVSDQNIRLRWIDPNLEACARLCRGAQRIGFFSCLFGGGKYGMDFSHACRCTVVDAYFQIHERALNFDTDSAENQVIGFSGRTDSTIIHDFAIDASVAGTNSFDALLPKGATVREEMFLKEAFDEPDADSSRIRKFSGQLQLDAQKSGGSVRLGVNGASMFVANGANGRASIHDASGVETWRSDNLGNITPRAASGTQSIGDASHRLSEVHANMLVLGDGVTAPSPVAGLAKMFIDVVDGDLKIVFGDGVTKTIVTDI